MFRDILIANAAKRGWSNLGYVSSGLVAAYDGQFNAGDALHDPTATSWYNHAGTSVLPNWSLTSYAVSDGGAATWSDNYLYVPNGTAFNSVSYPASVSNFAITIECVQRCPSSSGNGETVAFMRATETSTAQEDVGIRLNTGNAGYGRIWGNTSIGNGSSGTSNTTVLYTLTAYQTSSKCYGLGYMNGTAILDAVASTSTRYNPDYFGVAPKAGSTYAANRCLYSIRVYRRVLTDAEIAANYAIDARRFNIT